MADNPFYNTRRVKRIHQLRPVSGAPGALQSGGNITRDLREAPPISLIGAAAAQAASAGAFQSSIEAQEAPIVRSIEPLKYSRYQQIPLLIGIVDAVVLAEPTRKRNYLFIQNTHPTQSLYVNFGAAADTFCVELIPKLAGQVGGFFEWNDTVPQDAIHLIGSGAGTSGTLIYSESDI